MGAIWPGEFRSGVTWILLDRSPSMGNEPDLESWLEQTEISLEEWREAVQKQRVISFPNADGNDSPDLALALVELRKTLAPPDRLFVRTDGKALSPLPDPLDWAGIQLEHLSPQAQPRFHQVLAPSAWPTQGDLWVRIRMLDADLANGKLDVLDTSRRIASVEILNQGESWFALRLHCEVNPTESMELQLRWSENAGQVNTSLRIAPAGQPTFTSISLETKPDVLRRRLQNGEVLLLASNEYFGWHKLPQDLQIFRTKEASDETPLYVLLDVSGSMEGAGMLECRRTLLELRNSWTSGPIWVYPFQQDLLDGFILNDVDGSQRLQDLRAFGPTNLRKAISSMASRLSGLPAVLILSDGATGDPDLNWQEFLEQTLPDTAVYCLPAGDQADWEFLAGLGLVLDEGELTQRLDLALRDFLSTERHAVHPSPQASFPLPDTWISKEGFLEWEAAPGAEALLEGVSENIYLAARRVGPGLLIGLAETSTGAHQGLLAPIVQHFQAPGHSGWVGERFLVQSASTPPQCLQDGLPLEVRMLDPESPVLWQAMHASPIKPVHVQFENGRHWTASSLTSPEYGNSPQLWNTWQENQRNGLTGPVFRPRLLWAGLIMMTMAFVLRKLSQR